MPVTRVAIGGLGAIGRVVARKLAGGIPGLVLACAAARDHAKAQAWLDAERIACPLVEPELFPLHADLAIECAPAAVLERICRPMLEAGKQVMVLSAGALLPRPELAELAKQRGGQIIVPTGALLGLDAVTAAAEGRIQSVRMLANSGAALVVAEATGIERRGRITHGCLGLYSDDCEAALARVVAHCRRYGTAKLGIQLAHARCAVVDDGQAASL